MEKDIIRKIRAAWAAGVETEERVVYLMVELRKLMELNGDFDRYSILKFYCDWVAHPSMDRGPAQRLVERFDRYEKLLHFGAFEAGAPQLSDADKEVLADLRSTLELTNFQRELTHYLLLNAVNEFPFETWGSWIAFLKLYVAVIQDCPLRCRGQGLEFVNEVIARVIEGGDEIDEGQLDITRGLRIEWSWLSIRTGITRTYTLLLSSAWDSLRGGEDF